MDSSRAHLHPLAGKPQSCTHQTTEGANASARRVATMLLASAAFLFADRAAMAHDDEIRVQGNWAYTQSAERDAAWHLATTPAAEGDVWLLLACSRDEKLTVALVHNTKFSFPLKASSSIQLRSKDLPIVSVEGRSADTRQIVLDPSFMRHVMPSIVREDQLVISVPEQAGPVHDYTFALQPNDTALRAIRSHCFQ